MLCLLVVLWLRMVALLFKTVFCRHDCVHTFVLPIEPIVAQWSCDFCQLVLETTVIKCIVLFNNVSIALIVPLNSAPSGGVVWIFCGRLVMNEGLTHRK